jgi:hypothetical protein
MNQKDIQEWQQKKAKELFTLSHKLLDTAKQLSEHHANELKHNCRKRQRRLPPIGCTSITRK